MDLAGRRGASGAGRRGAGFGIRWSAGDAGWTRLDMAGIALPGSPALTSLFAVREKGRLATVASQLDRAPEAASGLHNPRGCEWAP